MYGKIYMYKNTIAIWAIENEILLPCLVILPEMFPLTVAFATETDADSLAAWLRMRDMRAAHSLGDVNGDGKAKNIEATLILQFYAGLIARFRT